MHVKLSRARCATGPATTLALLRAGAFERFSPYLQRRIARMGKSAMGTKLMPADTSDNVVGRQFICDYWGCRGNIGSKETVLEVLKEAVQRANATLLELFIHQFSPHGLTAIAIIAESHIIIHTWPDKGYVALDVFTCGNETLPEQAVEVLRTAFTPALVQTREVRRKASYELPDAGGVKGE